MSGTHDWFRHSLLAALTVLAGLPSRAAAQPPGAQPPPKTQPPPQGETTLEPKTGADKAGSAASGKPQPPAYSPVRTDAPPRIDGVLDDPIWRDAPIDARFFSEESKPYGQPSTVPTAVQVAYDREHLYVAFRCQYGEDPAADAVPLGAETDLIEYVGVYLDARHDHWSAKTFTLSPRGYRADFEAWQNGNERNLHWTGIWDGASHRFAGGWTAEFAIPWGTIGIRPDHDDFEIGLNFRRYFNPGHVVWAPPPPGSPRPRPSFYGHLSDLSDVAPGQTVLLVPYVAVGYTPGLPSYRYDLEDPVLSDFDRDLTSLAPYGGLFARVSLGKLRTDVVVNPDFSQVTPDAALANLDNYQLRFPEVRNFFVDATPVFRFGPDQFQLFYTRRLGLRQRTRRFDEIPIPFAVNTTYLQRGTSLALMHVLTSGLDGPIENGVDTTVDPSHATIVRARQTFGPTNVGVLAMNQTRPFSPSAYRAYGVDGALSLYENHLTLNGFAARSDKLIQFKRLGVAGRESKRRDYEGYSDYAWQTGATWKSEAFEAGLSYIDVGEEFNADLGYFERTGIRRTQAYAEYIAQIHSDLVRTVTMLLNRTETFSNVPERSYLYPVDFPDQGVLFSEKLRTSLSATARLLDEADLNVTFTEGDDTLISPAFFAGRRIAVTPGSYPTSLVSVSLESAPQRALNLRVSYGEGTAFGWVQRDFTSAVSVRHAWFGAQLLYQHIILDLGPAVVSQRFPAADRSLTGDRVSGLAVVSPTPDLRFQASVEMNTFDPTGTGQFIASWRLRNLTHLALIASRSAPDTETWVEDAYDRILLKFSYDFAYP